MRQHKTVYNMLNIPVCIFPSVQAGIIHKIVDCLTKENRLKVESSRKYNDSAGMLHSFAVIVL